MSRRSTSGPYLLSSPLHPGIVASRGPASGAVSHGRAARPAVLLPVPLRHVCLRSAGLKPFALDWCPSGHSRLLSRRILSRGVRPLPLHRCPAGSSRRVSGRGLSIDFQSVISTCCRPVPLGWFPPRCTRRGIAVYPDPAGRAYNNARAGVWQENGDPRVRNRCSGRETTSMSLQQPAQHVASPGGLPPRRSLHPPHSHRRRRPLPSACVCERCCHAQLVGPHHVTHTRTTSAGSSHGGPTGRGVVRQVHWLTAAPF